MKRLTVTLTALLAISGLSMASAEAAVHHKKPMHKPKHTMTKKHVKKHSPRQNHRAAPHHEMNMDIPADLKISENRGMNHG